MLRKFSFYSLAFMFAFSWSASSLAQTIDWKKYDHIDPTRMVPDIPLKNAIMYYDHYQDRLTNRNYISIVDFTPVSTQKRYFLIDMRSGQVTAYLVAHGEGTDPKNTGYAEKFSNIENSFMSSLGFFITTRNVFNGKNGISLRIQGMDKTNNNALKRAIIVHGADYVREDLDPLGPSQGCFVLEHRFTREVIQKIANGSLIYSWIHPKLMGKTVDDIQHIKRP